MVQPKFLGANAVTIQQARFNGEKVKGEESADPITTAAVAAASAVAATQPFIKVS